jgi:ribonuclease HI
VENNCVDILSGQQTTVLKNAALNLWYKYLSSIIVGTTRFDDRLYAARMWTTDICDQPLCANAACEEEHWYYSCHHNKNNIDKASAARQEILDEIQGNSYYGNQRYQDLCTLFALPCLRISGICPERHPYTLPHATDQQEIDDIASLYMLAANRDKVIDDPHAVEGAHIIDDNGVDRLCVYTDGSCAMPRHTYLTHAGWGVAYGNAACTQNDSGLLASPVQTSYRAELRGVAQAIARVQCPAVFCVDCKSVVNQANKFMSTGVRDATKATEIWEFIYDRLELDVDHNITFKWVPSHLDDKEKRHK